MPQIAQINLDVPSVTPVFKYIDLENVPQSEQKGYEVRRTLEVVEVHTAGSRNSAPVFPVAAMWRRDGNRTITYAERWPEAYRAFKEGGPQNAIGTPLEMLRPQGVTPELISVCRVNKIYSVEALHNLSYDGIRALGVHANKLRDAARGFMADRANGVETQALLADQQAEMAELRAQLATLMAASAPAEPTEMQAVIPPDDGIAAMSDEDIKVAIAALNDGKRPAGNPSRGTIEAALRELRQAA
jgi:hypothetical protein